jgi:hypothetical protein
MKLSMHTCNIEDDFWRVRNFLREVFLLNDRLEHRWHVARLDYWRWHYIKTANITASVEKGMAIWEDADGKIIAALNHLGGSELRLHVHPHFRSAELEGEMLAYGEANYYPLQKTVGATCICPSSQMMPSARNSPRAVLATAFIERMRFLGRWNPQVAPNRDCLPDPTLRSGVPALPGQSAKNFRNDEFEYIRSTYHGTI